jgi:hypothetical protein
MDELPIMALPAATCCTERAAGAGIDKVDVEPLRAEEALLPGDDRGPDGDADPDHHRGHGHRSLRGGGARNGARGYQRESRNAQ